MCGRAWLCECAHVCKRPVHYLVENIPELAYDDSPSLDVSLKQGRHFLFAVCERQVEFFRVFFLVSVLSLKLR